MIDVRQAAEDSLRRIGESYPDLVVLVDGPIVDGQQQVRWSLTPAGTDALADLLVLMAASSAVGDETERPAPGRLCLHWLSQAALNALVVAVREMAGQDVGEQLRDLARQVRGWNRQIGEATRPVGPTGHRNGGNGHADALAVLAESRCRGCGCRIFGDVATRGACKACDTEGTTDA